MKAIDMGIALGFERSLEQEVTQKQVEELLDFRDYGQT
jgi:hypothetical protein